MAGGARSQQPDSSTLSVFAAGSLRDPLRELAQIYEQQTGTTVRMTFGPSGVLGERIVAGEHPDVFASADMANPAKVAKTNHGSPVRVFASDAVCVVAGADVKVDSATLAAVAIDPAIKIETAMPVDDPLGDFTEEVFAKMGAKKTLDAKAARLFGRRELPRFPAGLDANAYFLKADKVDLLFTYCSSTAGTHEAEPRLKIVQMPANLAVRVNYGYTVLGANANAADFGRFLESADAQAVFVKYGFAKIQK